MGSSLCGVGSECSTDEFSLSSSEKIDTSEDKVLNIVTISEHSEPLAHVCAV